MRLLLQASGDLAWKMELGRKVGQCKLPGWQTTREKGGRWQEKIPDKEWTCQTNIFFQTSFPMPKKKTLKTAVGRLGLGLPAKKAKHTMRAMHEKWGDGLGMLSCLCFHSTHRFSKIVLLNVSLTVIIIKTDCTIHRKPTLETAFCLRYTEQGGNWRNANCDPCPWCPSHPILPSPQCPAPHLSPYYRAQSPP